MSELLIWLRDDVLNETDWDIFSKLIAAKMQEMNERYFNEVLKIVG